MLDAPTNFQIKTKVELGRILSKFFRVKPILKPYSPSALSPLHDIRALKLSSVKRLLDPLHLLPLESVELKTIQIGL